VDVRAEIDSRVDLYVVDSCLADVVAVCLGFEELNCSEDSLVCDGNAVTLIFEYVAFNKVVCVGEDIVGLEFSIAVDLRGADEEVEGVELPTEGGFVVQVAGAVI